MHAVVLEMHYTNISVPWYTLGSDVTETRLK